MRVDNGFFLIIPPRNNILVPFLYQSHEGHRISSIKAKYNPVGVLFQDCMLSKDLPPRRPQDGKLNEAPFKCPLTEEGNDEGLSPLLSQPSSILEWMGVFGYQVSEFEETILIKHVR